MKTVGTFKIEKYDDGFWSSKNPYQDFREDTPPVLSLERDERSGVWTVTIMGEIWCETELFSHTGLFFDCIRTVREHLKNNS